ncbi:MAG: hypothetical protein NVS3B26_16530 [Mycobacteriales bacterium]
MPVQSGDYGVVRTHGWVAWCIRALTGTRDPQHGYRPAKVNHAVLAVSDTEMVEMRPHGACRTLISSAPKMRWYRPPGMTEQQRDLAANVANALVTADTGYAFIDILAQALYRVGHVRPALLRRFIETHRRMVCSQSVDFCLSVAGVHLFDDGRLPGLVSPADLQWLGEDNGWQVT